MTYCKSLNYKFIYAWDSETRIFATRIISLYHLRHMKRLFFFITLLFCSCGGNNDNGNSTIADYQGIWDLRFNVVSDECQLLFPGLPGFVDIHEITQSGSTVLVTSRSKYFSMAEGVVNEDGTLQVVGQQEGSFFGPDAICTMTTQVSYSRSLSSDDNQAENTFTQTIECSDGTICQSTALGAAVRREA